MHKDVLRFDVAMHYVLLSHLLEGLEHLHEIIPDVNLGNASCLLLLCYEAVQVSLVAVLQYEVYAAVGLVGYEVVQLEYVRTVSEVQQRFDLGLDGLHNFIELVLAVQ